MKKSLFIVALCALAVFAPSTKAFAQDTEQLTATLTGANEVGDAGGDLDGSGSATVTINPTTNEVCFTVTYADLDDVVGGHIHSAGAGVNGDVVVDFALDATKTAGCVAGEAATVAAILANPELFYVNVHTTPFAGGAIRGQLAAAAAATPTAAPTAAPTAEATAEPTAEATTTAETTGTQELAFTGDMTGFLAIGGAALVATGAGMVIASRRRS